MWIDLKSLWAKIKQGTLQVLGYVFKKLRTFLWVVLSFPFLFIKSKPLYESSNGYIVIRDYSTFLYPIRPERHSTLRIGTSPNNTDAERWIIENLGHDRDSLVEAVADFSENMARDLMVFRKRSYQIRKDTNDVNPRYRQRRFVPLPGRLINLGFVYLHFIPIQHADGARLRGFKAEPSLLSKKEIFVFKLPRRVCTWWEHVLLKYRLIASSKIAPDFSMDDLKRNDPTPGYNFEIYHKANVIELMLSLKKLGMQFNNIAESHVLGYYTTDMVLRFYKTLGVMRESLIEQLSQLIKKVGFDTSITLEGLPLPDEIEVVRKELQKGTIDFAEAWKRIKLKDDE